MESDMNEIFSSSLLTFSSPIFALIFERVKLVSEVQSSVCNSEKHIQGRDSFFPTKIRRLDK